MSDRLFRFVSRQRRFKNGVAMAFVAESAKIILIEAHEVNNKLFYSILQDDIIFFYPFLLRNRG